MCRVVGGEGYTFSWICLSLHFPLASSRSSREEIIALSVFLGRGIAGHSLMTFYDSQECVSKIFKDSMDILLPGFVLF